MFLYKNRLILGIISKIIKFILKIFYKIFSLFNLQLALLIGVVGLILYFTGVFNKSKALLIVFCILFILALVLGIIQTVRKLLGLNKKKQDGEDLDSVEVEDKTVPVKVEPKVEEEKTESANTYPVYSKVKGHLGYVMAEYEDRYELFFKTENGYKKIRVDYKSTGEK